MVYNFECGKLTKKLLAELKSEEEYMSFYLGIVPNKGLHKNPLRADKRPTCSFYRAKNGELIFKDFQTGFHANFVEVVMAKFHCDFVKALQIIANDFGFKEQRDLSKNKCQAKYGGEKIDSHATANIQCEIQDFTPAELKWWQSYGLQATTLKLYNVVSVKNLFLNGSYLLSSSSKSPIYGYYFGREEGRELWKVYFPNKVQFRFMSNTNKLQGSKQLPSSGEYVVVTKSLKDVMVLHELGIPAVAPQAESVIITPRQYQALKKRFKHVIVNGDWDRAGQKFMIESRKRYECICLSFTNKECDGKDISDFVKKHGMDAAREIVQSIKLQIEKGLLNYHLRYSKCAQDVVSLPSGEVSVYSLQYAV